MYNIGFGGFDHVGKKSKQPGKAAALAAKTRGNRKGARRGAKRARKDSSGKGRT
jgi:hypothetical protein